MKFNTKDNNYKYWNSRKRKKRSNYPSLCVFFYCQTNLFQFHLTLGERVIHSEPKQNTWAFLSQQSAELKWPFLNGSGTENHNGSLMAQIWSSSSHAKVRRSSSPQSSISSPCICVGASQNILPWFGITLGITLSIERIHVHVNEKATSSNQFFDH